MRPRTTAVRLDGSRASSKPPEALDNVCLILNYVSAPFRYCIILRSLPIPSCSCIIILHICIIAIVSSSPQQKCISISNTRPIRCLYLGIGIYPRERCSAAGTLLMCDLAMRLCSLCNGQKPCLALTQMHLMYHSHTPSKATGLAK